MGHNGSSVELTTEAVELSKGMLEIIGAYGTHAGADVRDVHLRASSQAPPTERILASADRDTGEGIHPRAASG
jgi:hypothetical protein